MCDCKCVSQVVYLSAVSANSQKKQVHSISVGIQWLECNSEMFTRICASCTCFHFNMMLQKMHLWFKKKKKKLQRQISLYSELTSVD